MPTPGCEMVSNVPIKRSLQSNKMPWIYGSWLERWIFAAKSLPSGSKTITAASPRGPWGQPEGGSAGSQLLPFSSLAAKKSNPILAPLVFFPLRAGGFLETGDQFFVNLWWKS